MSDPLADEALDFLQRPENAQHLATLVLAELNSIESFIVLPDSLRAEIEQRCALLYGAGFIRGARWYGDPL